MGHAFLPRDIEGLAMSYIGGLSKGLVAASTEPVILFFLSEGESCGYALIDNHL
jgi:hypothetical protein